MLTTLELETLQREIPCKSRELGLLSCFLQPEMTMMRPIIVLEGPKSSGKTYTVKRYLDLLKTNYKVSFVEIECQYCFSQRDVLRKILKELISHYKMKYTAVEREISTCEGIQSFSGCVKQVMAHVPLNKRKPFVFILTGVDTLPQIDDVENLAFCLSKLHEQFEETNGLTFVLTCVRSDWLNLQTSSPPIIKFQSYSIEDLKIILSETIIDNAWPVDLIRDHMNNSISLERRSQIFKQFVGLMMDTYREFFGYSIEIIEPTLRRIWPVFLDPIVRNGGYQVGQNDILTTFLKNKDILSEENVIFRDFKSTHRQLVDDKYDQDPLLTKLLDNLDRENNESGNFDLSKKIKYLVIASFLASFNDAKYDTVYFTKHGDGSMIKKRRNLKRAKLSKSEGVFRREMAVAQPFKMERFLAILRSIWLENEGNDLELVNDVGLMNEMASLSALRIIIKLPQGDTIGGQSKWKCNVHWNIVEKFAKDINFNIENHLQE